MSGCTGCGSILRRRWYERLHADESTSLADQLPPGHTRGPRFTAILRCVRGGLGSLKEVTVNGAGRD